MVSSAGVDGHRLVLANALAIGVCGGFLLLACLAIDAISIGLCACELQSKQAENTFGIPALWVDGLGWNVVFIAI